MRLRKKNFIFRLPGTNTYLKQKKLPKWIKHYGYNEHPLVRHMSNGVYSGLTDAPAYRVAGCDMYKCRHPSIPYKFVATMMGNKLNVLRNYNYITNVKVEVIKGCDFARK